MTITQFPTTESTDIQPPSDKRLREMAKQIQIEIGALEARLAANWLRSLYLTLDTAATILEERLPEPEGWEDNG